MVATVAWTSRIVSATCQFLVIRTLLAGLGSERYAVFSVLVGLTGVFSLSDLGLGFSLQNVISEKRARSEAYLRLEAVAILLQAAATALLLLLVHFAAPWLSTVFLGRILEGAPVERTRLFEVFAGLSLVSTASSISYRAFYAEQRGYLANGAPAVVAILSLVGVTLAARFNDPDRLHVTLVAYLLPTAVVPLFLLIWRVSRIPAAAWRPSADAARAISKRATGFWLYAVVTAFILQIDYIVLARYANPDQIVLYNLTSKVFWVVDYVYGSLLLALWPTVAEHAAKGQWLIIKRYLRTYIPLGVLFVICCTAALVAGMPTIFRLLAPEATPSVVLTILFGTYFCLRVWTDSFATVLKSQSSFTPFLKYLPAQAVLSVTLQLLLVPSLGAHGIVIAVAASFALTVAWALPMSVRRAMQDKPSEAATAAA